MNSQFKKLKARCIESFLGELSERRGVIPEEFAETWVNKRWRSIEGYARGAVTHSMSTALREMARTKCTESICKQLHLPGDFFAELPIAVPTANGGYSGAGLATVEDWERSIADHNRQIVGHEASICRILGHIETRRSLGIDDDFGWQERKR